MDDPGRAVIPPRRPAFRRLSRRLPDRPEPRTEHRAQPAVPDIPPPVHLYEVLMDPEHPAFRDLGRLLWTMVATQSAWVDRRVETASLAGERRFRRHMSVDCRVPPPVLDLVSELGFTRFLVPLRFVTKRGPMLAFDLRLDDQSVPWLTRPQNTMAARSILYAAVDQLGIDIDPDLEAVLGEVAGLDVSAAPRALEQLGLTQPGRVGNLATPAELVHWLVTTLDHNFLLLADVGLNQVRRRTVFKITQELGLRVKEPLPWRAQVAWDPTSFVFDCPDVTATTSYHFQFVAPDGMVIAGGDLFGASAEVDESGAAEITVVTAVEAATDAPRPHGRHLPATGTAVAIDPDEPAYFGASASQGSVLGLNTHVWDVPDAASYNVEVLVRPSPDGLLRASAVSAGFSTLLLLLAAGFRHRLDSGRLDASIALLLVLPGVMSTLLARPGEHHLVSRLLRGVRMLTLFSAFTVYFAAAIVVAGVAGQALQLWWLGLALLSAVPSVVLTVAVRHCRIRHAA